MHVLSTPPAFVLSQDQTLRECLPVIRCTRHESGTTGRNRPDRSQRPRCVFSKEPQRCGRCPSRRGINISGVDFWHAVEFSRNGRFLCTHPRGLSSGRFPSVLRFRLYQIFPIRFPRGFRLPGFPLSRFPFPAAPTLSDPFGPDFQSVALSARFGLSPVGLSTFTTLADSLARFTIGLHRLGIQT